EDDEESWKRAVHQQWIRSSTLSFEGVRKHERHAQARVRVLNHQRSMVQTHGPGRNRESEPDAAAGGVAGLVHSKERLRQTRDVGFGNTRPTVANRHADPRRAVDGLDT